MARGLKHAEGSDQIGFDIAFGIVDGITHPRLRGEVDHRVRMEIGHEPIHDTRTLNPIMHNAEIGRLVQHRLAAFFEGDIIVIGHGI